MIFYVNRFRYFFLRATNYNKNRSIDDKVFLNFVVTLKTDNTTNDTKLEKKIHHNNAAH